MKSVVLVSLLGAAGVGAFAISNSIVDLAVATPDLSTLVTALKAAGLVDTLSGKGPFTVFAPTNEAFAALPAGVLTNLLKPENKAQLVDILTYHVASGDVQSKDLTDMEMIKTVEGKDVQARVTGSNILINSAKVTAADNEASNGVVHIIDAVLMPGSAPKPPAANTIVDLAVATPDLSTLVTALKAAGLVDTLSGKGPFTVFAPTNEAFAALPAGVLANLLKPENKAQLVDILTYHVASGDVVSGDIGKGAELDVKSVEGDTVQVTNACEDRKCKRSELKINQLSNGRFVARVTSKDNAASNGVVHIIDAVLTPGNGAKTIVDLAVADPDLSTLVTALKAAGLVDTLSGKGPFTVFAPTNEAFAALPAGVLANLLKPENKAQLVDILTYHVASGDLKYADFKDGEFTKTVEGKNVVARVEFDVDTFINDAKIFTGVNQKTSGDIDASNGVIHKLDSVLSPDSPPTKVNHLYFRGIDDIDGHGDTRCGEVDAAPRMPAALFEPQNAKYLKEYEDITIKFYKPRYDTGLGKLAVGRCKDVGYTSCASGEQGVGWAPTALMEPICALKCFCSYTPVAPGAKLPRCKDQPDDPKAGKWCSLCGPKFNDDITINFCGKPNQSVNAVAAA